MQPAGPPPTMATSQSITSMNNWLDVVAVLKTAGDLLFGCNVLPVRECPTWPTLAPRLVVCRKAKVVVSSNFIVRHNKDKLT